MGGGHRRRRGSGALTLLEVLVALTIAGMLGALLLPLASRARTRARQELCSDNLRRLAQAVQLYARDYDDFPPPAAIDYGREIPGVTWYRTNAYWPILLLSYVGGDQSAFRCPNAPHPQLPFGSGTEWKTYAINPYVAVRPDNHLGLKPRPLASVSRPERVGLFVDSAGVCLLYQEEFIEPPISDLSHFYGMSGHGRSTYLAHEGGANLVYVDGHTDWLPGTSYIKDPAAGRRIWSGGDTPWPGTQGFVVVSDHRQPGMHRPSVQRR